jgi:hypothetical protein
VSEEESSEGPVDKFRKELRYLSNQMMDVFGIGSKAACELVEQELAYIRNIEVNAHTVEAYLPSWLEQFRQNLVLTGGFKARSWPEWPVGKEHSCIIVGAGPSLADHQLEALGQYNGLVICSNKSLERVLKYTIPDMVVVIHATQDIAEHFTGPRAMASLEHIEVLVSTVVHPDVTRALLKYGNPDKIHWFNASIPDTYKRNMDEFMYYMSPCPIIDTGGNVGMTMCQIVKEDSRFSVVGLLGMEQALTLDPNWTNAMVADNLTICYAPEDILQPFAMDRVFHNYILTLMSWYEEVKGRLRVYNLSKGGFLYVNRRTGMPYLTVDEFIEAFG